jgi:hypothetical protein
MITCLQKFSFFKGLIILVFCSLYTAGTVSSQPVVSEVNLQKLPPKMKKKFVHSRYTENIVTLNDLIPSCFNSDDSANYRFQKESFVIKDDINKVWRLYKSLNINDSYSGHIVDFGFIYSKNEQSIIYLDDNNYEGMKEGQVIFISLNILGGAKKLMVAYEVTHIDESNKCIRFCYINNGISTGSQEIVLRRTENGFTKVTHNTAYKSESKFRDAFIYPIFHHLIVKELHANLIRSL